MAGPCEYDIDVIDGWSFSQLDNILHAPDFFAFLAEGRSASEACVRPDYITSTS